jgi:hypothetical protein
MRKMAREPAMRIVCDEAVVLAGHFTAEIREGRMLTSTQPRERWLRAEIRFQSQNDIAAIEVNPLTVLEHGATVGVDLVIEKHQKVT